ncbi:hypothetical protein IQ06DRAFT_324098 [Phaeosphaeriaceae sp. SRC1lsM3a]|nr:hypothetical protein IQ06DRAFT_324098 [Stagonospora sp. SRC1lsM3a]
MSGTRQHCRSRRIDHSQCAKSGSIDEYICCCNFDQLSASTNTYHPKANVGDTIEFRFYPTNHSVVRAEYGFPCIPYEMSGPNKQGFFSGFNAIDKVVDDPPKYSIKINDTNPIFFYCSAPASCIKYGMIGVINPNASTPISTQAQLARDSAYMLNPGEPFPPEAPLPSNLPSSTAIPVAPVVHKHQLSTGAIAGIVVAAIGVVLLCGGLFFCWGRTRTLKDEVERNKSSVAWPAQAQSPMQEQMHYSALPLAVPFQHQHQHQQHQHLQHQDHKPLHIHPPSSPPLHHHPAFSPSHTAYELPISPHDPSPHPNLHPNPNPYFATPTTRTHTRSPSASDTKYGPYGLQQRQSTGTPAPPYGWHVNQAGPAEMEGTSPGTGRRERVRWEEVGVRESREGRMF